MFVDNEIILHIVSLNSFIASLLRSSYNRTFGIVTTLVGLGDIGIPCSYILIKLCSMQLPMIISICYCGLT